MFLRRTIARNPELIRAAVELHQAGAIPPNTFVFDADAFTANAAVLRAAAEREGLELYFMTKQHGRNPDLFGRIVRPGAHETVAVAMEDARILHRAGIALGHVGNLVQTPRGELEKVIGDYRPEVISVFTLEKARQVDAAAAARGVVQPVLLRVHGPDDILFPGMEGGFRLEDLGETLAALRGLENVRVAGVTSFPVLRYDAEGGTPVATPNLGTLSRARDRIESEGIEIEQVNAPGNTAAGTMAFLRGAGATHVEPGSALTASTTFHLYDDELPEQPAMVYLTEVAHRWAGKAYVYGGGFFVDDPPVPLREGFRREALVGASADDIFARRLRWEGIGPEGAGSFASIDYHGILSYDGPPPAVGESVVFGFRAQLFMTRAYVAVVEGLGRGVPRLVGVWDWAAHRIGGGVE
ncbi:MAG TPA: alanine racemase [Solirubrobacterales bacterium]|nr:alanine racemase [Solirubrobacterales bacterium]